MKVEIELTDMKERIMKNLKHEYGALSLGLMTPNEYADRVKLLGSIFSDMFFDCSNKEAYEDIAEFLSTLEDIELKMRNLKDDIEMEQRNRLSKMELPF